MTAVPTSGTTPVWAQSNPDEPAPDDATPAPAMPVKKSDPDWSGTVSAANGEADKKAPEWAQTVPTSPGEPVDEGQPVEKPTEAGEAAWSEAAAAAAPQEEHQEAHEVHEVQEVQKVTQAPITEPPKAVASDQLKSTWPPRSENTPAPAQETDIWPPDPPTEPSMPAWPPSSEVSGHAQEEEPATPAQAIPSWPDSFEEPAVASTVTPALAPEPAPEPEPVAPTPPVVAQSTPPAPAIAAQEASTPPTASTPSVSQTARPVWAPGGEEADAPAAPHRESAPAMQIPAWAPRVPLAAEPGTPTWFSPKEQIPHPTTPSVTHPTPKPEPPPPPPPAPTAGGQLPVASAPPPPPAPPTQPPAQQGKAAWQVVQQAQPAKAPQGPTAEDRSYAEWFAWAKRGGAPATACHAAAQGAFKALSSGKDVTTAVQWATAAMSRPPENVSFARQQYCAWFALANIDLNMDQQRSHAFAGAAVQALDAGMDASAAHAAGLHAAGYR